MKTAVIYDKWLDTLGGGEVVACQIAKMLKESGYDVIFICGKKISYKLIKEKTNIDLKGIKFIEVWNDEVKIKKIVEGKDLFINVSFMDYSFGYAKKNIYYTHFPTEIYNNLKGFILNKIILPIFARFIKPIEFINKNPIQGYKNNQLMYLIDNNLKIAFSHLNFNETYLLKFSIFFENFYKSLIEDFNFDLENAQIEKKQIKVDHQYNVVHFYINLKPKSSTIFLNLKNKNLKEKVYLINPKILIIKIPDFIYKIIYEKINTKLRAGIFNNIKERLKTYDKIICHSNFVKKSIKKFWNLEADVVYPPVDLLFKKYDLSKIKKNNWICSIGRFFTLGHGKKQEVLIKAFKRLYKKGCKNWQLHLIGGLNNETSSIKFINNLKKQSKGYPIFFHLNIDRKKVEKILLKSKIYWHATGYGENENKNPIKFEHFGIAPIEAISAGCIPVLYNGGGLKETVEIIFKDEKDNYLFSKIDELVKKTGKIIEKKIDLKIDLKESLNTFDKKNFLKKLKYHLIQ